MKNCQPFVFVCNLKMIRKVVDSTNTQYSKFFSGRSHGVRYLSDIRSHLNKLIQSGLASKLQMIVCLI